MTPYLSALLDQVLAHADITSQPDSRGQAKGWCPWHADKAGGNPSLSITVSRGLVKCFVCDEPKERPILALAEAWGIKSTADAQKEWSDIKPWEKEIEATYDYLDEDGKVLFQVVRFTVPAGMDKGGVQRFAQRRPVAEAFGGYKWDVKGVPRVLYNLPAIKVAADDEWVYLVEGEKDADRLIEAGLLATTVPMGAKGVTKSQAAMLTGRRVCVIPDDDDAGHQHMHKSGKSLREVVAQVKVLELPDYDDKPPKSDVSDYLDHGGSIRELAEILEASPEYKVSADAIHTNRSGPNTFAHPRYRSQALAIITELSSAGYFVWAEKFAYYFDKTSRILIQLEEDNDDLRILLNERFHVNRRDGFYGYLVEQLRVEAGARGESSVIRLLSHYDRGSETMLLDMGAGRTLRIRPDGIEERYNGEDGALFGSDYTMSPWRFKPNAPSGIMPDILIEPIHFSKDSALAFNPDEQRLLMLLWVVSLPFSSGMPTKPLALAVGPTGSGKTNVFRRLGRMLMGPEYEVDTIDSQKDDDFWVAISTEPLVCFDNVEGYIRWLENTLARAATGVRFIKRKLYTNNTSIKYKSKAVICLTAMSPKFRRPDIASRLLIFHLDKIDAKREEAELWAEIDDNRDVLMSDLAKMIQRVLAVERADLPAVDASIRMADFAHTASRIGASLGDDVSELTQRVLGKLTTTQRSYAVEEDDLAAALAVWIDQEPAQKALDGGKTNSGRLVSVPVLFGELKAVAGASFLPWRIADTRQLGARLRNLREPLSDTYDIETSRPGGNSHWQITKKVVG